jgi:hypothetical protein
MKTKVDTHVPSRCTHRWNLKVALMLVLLVATLSHAQLTPTGDAYTNTADPTTNFGAKTLLDVESPSQTTYIQFNLESIPAGFTGVTKATLKLYVNAVTKAGSFNVDYVNGTWSEGTIDANNAPALGSTIAASVPLTTADKNQYILIDITAAVQAWLNGSQANVGIALVGNSPLNTSFDSKENTTTSHPPELDVVFAVGTLTGVTTASGSGLTGGGTSGTLNLRLLSTCASGQVLEWNGTAWACATGKGTGTITGVTAGTDLTGGGTSGKVTLNLDTTQVPQLNAANAFTTVQNIAASGNYDGLDSTAAAPGYNGVTGVSFANTGAGSGVLGLTLSPSGFGVTGFGGSGVQGTSSICCGVGGNFAGYSGASGSGQAGTNGVVATGGAGDPMSCCFNGGDAIVANGGVGSNYGGTGVVATGASGGAGGNGVSGYGGSGADGGVGGHFQGAASGSYSDGIDAFTGTSYAFAGNFTGDVYVSGEISASTKNFKIDHPLDPANSYLVHASVESSEMMNIYTGNVTTDAQGGAIVQMPGWFEVLNTDFRYQLTVIGQFAQAIIARKIESNRFEIRTNAPNVEVSWQITGVRQDAYAKAHPLVVEEQKEPRLQGFYIHPELYGAPEEKQIEWARHPGMMKQMKAKRGAPPASPLIPLAPVLLLRTTPAVGGAK